MLMTLPRRAYNCPLALLALCVFSHGTLLAPHKGAVRLASTVMVQVGEILKILNLAKFQSIFENTPLFFEIFDYFFTF